MRLLGILLIILAHVNPPNIIFQARTFDVPMMIFISGMSYSISGKSSVKIVPYMISRFKRLVLPVWFFFSLFFLYAYLFNYADLQDRITIKTIALTFLLSGFGYVWIIKVFLLIALLSPLLTLVANKFNGYSLSIVSMALLIISSLLYKTVPIGHYVIINSLITDIFIPCISYGAVFLLGYRSMSFTKKKVLFSLSVNLFAFIVCVAINLANHEGLAGPQQYKYPPTIYFISFSLVMTWIIYVTFNKINVKELNGVIKFISSNTIWIYLWHIPVVEYFKASNMNWNFAIKYIIAVVISTSITYIQVSLVKKITKGNNKKMINIVFTG